ncbi:MAG: histidinol-phosphate transaminase [Rhodospirillales bacterium]
MSERPESRPGIMEIAAYVGGESSIPGVDRIIKLSSNEGPFGPSPLASKAHEAEATGLHRYPDGGAVKLRAAIGARYGLDPDRIVCGAGSDELISLLCKAYAGPGDEVLYAEHGFLMYPISARTVGATPVTAAEVDRTADVDNLLAAVTDKTRILFLANPNNPTGTYLPADEVKRLRDGLRDDILLVIDAAYAEYVTVDDYTPGIELVDAGDNTVMTRTFSKIHGLGGVRLGWCYAPANVVDVLNRIRGPFNVGAAAMAAGIAAIGDKDFEDMSRAHNIKWREWTAAEFRNLGLDVTPSIGNFLLVCFGADKDRGAEAADSFLKSKGIVVRRMGGYGFPNCLRITIGLEDEMRAVVDTLSQFLGKNEPGAA